jgi:hypothetical protein
MECGIENLQAKSMLGKPRMRMSWVTLKRRNMKGYKL